MKIPRNQKKFFFDDLWKNSNSPHSQQKKMAHHFIFNRSVHRHIHLLCLLWLLLDLVVLMCSVGGNRSVCDPRLLDHRCDDLALLRILILKVLHRHQRRHVDTIGVVRRGIALIIVGAEGPRCPVDGRCGGPRRRRWRRRRRRLPNAATGNLGHRLGDRLAFATIIRVLLRLECRWMVLMVEVMAEVVRGVLLEDRLVRHDLHWSWGDDGLWRHHWLAVRRGRGRSGRGLLARVVKTFQRRGTVLVRLKMGKCIRDRKTTEILNWPADSTAARLADMLIAW